jgi:hypothetical protein
MSLCKNKKIIDYPIINVTNFRCILDEHEGIYDGTCKNNKMHGFGKFTFDDEYSYEGLFVDGQRVMTERGKLYFPLSEEWEVFDGYFNYDFTCDKEGKLIYRDGTIYDGQFDDGKYHGIGKIIYPSGNSYEGNFVKDKMKGIGKMIYKDSIVKSITAHWIDENNFNYENDVKFEFDDNLSNKFKDIKEEIESFDIFPNILHKYIPILGKKTKRAELEYVLRKKYTIANL